MESKSFFFVAQFRFTNCRNLPPDTEGAAIWLFAAGLHATLSASATDPFILWISLGRPIFAICAIGSINSHYFHMILIGDGKLNPIVGVYIPIITIPIKSEMTIPNIGSLDPGTFVG